MSPTQDEIFGCVYRRQAPTGQRRIHVTTYTRFGKSDIISMATLSRVTTFPEKWYVISGTEEKTQIIMGYIIDHIGDSEYCRYKFKIDKGESYDRIRRQRSRKKVTFRVEGNAVGEIETLSTQEKRKVDPLEPMMGKGAPNILFDESSLTSDIKYVGVLRMLADWKDPFICEIGNAFRRNHFYKMSIDPSYYHIVADWRRGLAEGRITMEQIDLMRKNTDSVTFGILYDCIFPPAGQMDSEGWIPYITDEQYEIIKRYIQAAGRKRLGLDVGEGGSPNVWAIRTDNRAWVKSLDYEADPMKTADKTRAIIKEEAIRPVDVGIDTTGPGLGVCSRLHQLKCWVNSVKSGLPAKDKESYTNIKSECYRLLQKWMLEGGTLRPHQAFDVMLKLRHRTIAKHKWEIVPKLKFFSWGYPSPHGPEALALTFITPSAFIQKQQDEGGRNPLQYLGNEGEVDPFTGATL